VPASAQAATGDFAAFPICTEPADQLKPQVEGELVVWQDQRAGNNDVYGRYLSGNEFPICTHAGGQDFPAVYGNLAVCQDDRNGNWDIYGAIIPEPCVLLLPTAGGIGALKRRSIP